MFRALSSSAAITASIMNYSLIGNSISFSMIYSELYENANRKTLQYAEKIAEQIRKSDGNK